jgi:mono/diheme cytochrome c family protein
LLVHVFIRWIAAGLALGQSAAFAQDVGDPAAGHDFAREVCAECHDVEAPFDQSPNPDAPTFHTIANVPGMTATALFVVLRTPHRQMPNLILERDELHNVAAYILTLKDND